ncbi:hypothetical protein MKW98_022738 [Papaver atlanticum]|uniref:Uncharacterized protein n=1 Tax=Papaver atlanticum TaxID=357466 RepID=A0AAD4TLF8_9MAGN|nr:hypothetical protein MKW98_022738 [Papaver atlanticum]
MRQLNIRSRQALFLDSQSILRNQKEKRGSTREKVPIAEEDNVKKSKGSQSAGVNVISDGVLATDGEMLLEKVPSVQSHGEENIILSNPQMIRNSIVSYDDPFDMFNDYIIDIPASTPPVVPINLRTEMVESAPRNSQVHNMLHLFFIYNHYMLSEKYDIRINIYSWKTTILDKMGESTVHMKLITSDKKISNIYDMNWLLHVEHNTLKNICIVDIQILNLHNYVWYKECIQFGSLKIMSWNCQGCGKKYPREHFKNLVQSIQLEIIFLSETKKS